MTITDSLDASCSIQDAGYTSYDGFSLDSFLGIAKQLLFPYQISVKMIAQYMHICHVTTRDVTLKHQRVATLQINRFSLSVYAYKNNMYIYIYMYLGVYLYSNLTIQNNQQKSHHWLGQQFREKHQPFPPANSTYLQKSHRSRSQTSHRRVLSVEWEEVCRHMHTNST